MAGKFEWLSVIGSGTFGEAWLAKCLSTKTKCVIKVIKIQKLSQKELDQCLTEVTVLARCTHRNIVTYKDAFVDKSALNIVMEYAEGGDLHRKITEQKGIHFGREVILDWFVQICLALQYIHERNILHRDLKSHNIFLGTGNVIKIGDFGIARILGANEDHAMTVIGTPFYISPEICQRKPYNSKSDMWAAGCVLYELCCLHVPFNARDFQELTIKILQGKYEPLPKYFGSTLCTLVAQLLDVLPEKRLSADRILSLPELRHYVKRHTEQDTLDKMSALKMAGNDDKDREKKQISEKAEGKREDKGARPKKKIDQENVKRPRPGSSEVSNDELEQNEDRPVGKTYKVKNPKFRRLSLATPRIRGIVARQRATLSAEYDKKSADYEDDPKHKLFENFKKKRIDSGPQLRSGSEISNNEDDVFMQEAAPSSCKDKNNNDEEIYSSKETQDSKEECVEPHSSDSVNSRTYSVVNPSVVSGAASLPKIQKAFMFNARTLYNTTMEARKSSHTAADYIYMKLIKLMGQKRLKQLTHVLSEFMTKGENFDRFKEHLTEEEVLLFPLILQYHCLCNLKRPSLPG